ncbi:hypothetical protein BDV96DRAFT_600558 [Lophiotrema nucula]|uniref:Zn(2)-C6 fungal-type domain-containing protein n=1 Tax=Lophiotrema nucula TaxID=690887 RepID=A0A6A5Z5G3_9PLEO|nr:hypothetical protein BDV96DRAFT_600558 [Lophiotrema nucula]
MEVTRRSATAGPTQSAACERCHRSRERCTYDANNHSCLRCLRFGIICESRKWKRMGRKPRSVQRSPVTGLRYSVHVYSLDPVPKVPERIAESILSEEGFFNATSHFMIGRTFAEGFRRVVLQLFAYSPEVLGDGCQALAESMRTQRSSSSDPFLSHHLKLGTRCLRSFIAMSATAKSMQDAAVLTFLGQILLAYNALLPLGSSTRIVTRGSLLASRSWYPVMQNLPVLDNITVVPVLIDTIDCLIRREVPIVRWQETERVIVDRFAGVSSSLLPLMYDVCIISHRAKEPTFTSALNYQYCQIEDSIVRWQPQVTSEISEKYTKNELDLMIAQARSYRLAVLLIIHRLRYSLGVEDNIGCRYANRILEELTPLLQYPSEKAATGFGIDFPLLVAAIEIPERGMELLTRFERFRYRTRQAEDMLNLIGKIQRARLSGYEGLWFDLIGDWMTGDILP